MPDFIGLLRSGLSGAIERLAHRRQRHDSLADLDERGLRDLGIGAGEVAFIDAASRRYPHGLSRRDFSVLCSRGIA